MSCLPTSGDSWPINVADTLPDLSEVFRAAGHSAVHAKSVVRVGEEQTFFRGATRRLRDKGWDKATRAARLLPLPHAMRSASGALSGKDVKPAGALTRRASRPVR